MKTASFAGLLCCGILLATPALAEPLTLNVEPPAEGYSDKKPDYLHFKEIKVTRDGKKDMTFDISLQGKIPDELPENTGVRYKIYIDLAGLITGSAEKKVGDFEEDIQIVVYKNPGTTEFKTWTHTLKYRSKKWSIAITRLDVDGDQIYLSATSNLFAERNIDMRFLLSSGLLQGTGRSKKDRKVQDTAVYDLPGRSVGGGAF